MLKNKKLLDALLEREALKAKLAEIDAAIKETAQYLVEEAKGDSVLDFDGGLSAECKCVRRIAPKYKELAFELAGNHPEAVQILADSDPKRFLKETVSYQIHLIEEK
jgi:hypothetical protein